MPISASQAVRDSVLKLKYEAEQARMAEAENKLCLYKDDYEEIIRSKMAELFHPDNYKRLYYHVNQSQNILKRVINELSMIYKAEAKRTLGKKEDSPGMKRYAEVLADNNWDVKSKRVNRYANLMNECLVKVGVRNGRIVYDLITPNICGVVQNEEDPTIADAIYYSVNLTNTVGDVDTNWYYYDVQGNVVVYDKEFRPVQVIYTPEDNPLRDAETGDFIIPFAVGHRAEPDDSFFDQDTGRDLYNASVLQGIRLTLFDYYMKVCSFKQIYVIGSNVKIPDGQIADPITVFKAEDSPEGRAQIGTLDLQINMDQFINALQFFTNAIITTYGIAPDAWTMSISELSGRALKIKNRALLEARSDQLPMFRKFETDLFRITRAVNNAYAGSKGAKWRDKIDESEDIAVDFGEIGFEEDPMYEIGLETKRLQSGLVSLGQYYQRFNPDVKDEKEAEKAIVGNLEKVETLRKQHPALDDMLNAVFETKGKGGSGSGDGGEGGFGTDKGDTEGRKRDKQLEALNR